jgi:hypothetical protein
MSTTSTTDGTRANEAHIRAAAMQDEARAALRAALASRQAADGTVTFPASDADRIARACSDLKPGSHYGHREPRNKLLMTTGGVPSAIAELEKLNPPESIAGHVTAALNRARVALKLRKAAIQSRSFPG